MRWAARALLVSLLLGPLPARAGTVGPVAVLPFKNLNRDPDLDWLSRGVAETMIADLKRSGHVTVVERDQLDAALSEVERGGLKATDPATATQVGKMVGARVVIVGSFQRAADRLRFVARMVEVETGVVGQTAKVTGPTTRVFALQDRIVQTLLGIPPPRRRARRPASPKKEKARLRAYRLYAMSLQTATDADQAHLLKEAIAVDPDFVYAVEDLERLERRLERYRTTRDARQAETNEAVRKKLEAETDPMRRMQEAILLLSSDLQSMRYAALIRDASTIYAMHWTRPADAPTWTSPKELAASNLVQGHTMLKHYDVALQLGERFLKEFPGSVYYPAVENLMRSIIETRRAQAEGKAKLDAEIEAIEAERRARLERARERGRAVPPRLLASFDLKRCSRAASLQQWRRAIDLCEAFLETWKAETEPTVGEWRAIARFNVLRALAELGRFDEARAGAKQMIAEMPEAARRYHVADLERVWPR